MLAVEQGALHKAQLQLALCSPPRHVIVRPGTRSQRRAPLQRAGSIAQRLVMNKLLNQKTLFSHIVLLNHKMRLQGACAAAGRVIGAAHDARLAVACRRQRQQPLVAMLMMGAAAWHMCLLIVCMSAR